jgi:hypothetical protein
VVSEAPSAAQTGATCIAAPLDRAAAMAKLSFVRVPRGTAAGADLDCLAAERAAILRITIPYFVELSRHAHACPPKGIMSAKA